MAEVVYDRDTVPTSTPVARGEMGLDASGNLQVHNGTVAATVYSTANPPPGTGATSFASSVKFGPPGS